MDVQRIVLIGALATVTYLMVLAWNDDYGQQSSAAIPNQQSQATSAANNETDFSSMETAQSQTSGDFPSISPAPTQTSAVAGEPANLIDINTNLIHAKIDPHGGDIVHIALKQYPKYIDQPDNPFLLLQKNQERTYIAQSGLIGRDGPDTAQTGRPTYVAANSEYKTSSAEPLVVDLQLAGENNVHITKRFTFTNDSYLVGVEYIVQNNSSNNWQGNFSGQLKRDNSKDPSTTTKMGMSSYLGAALTTEDERYKKVDFDDVDPGDDFKTSKTGGWIAILQHYFVSAWIPQEEANNSYQVRKSNNGQNIAGFVSPVTQVLPGETGTLSAKLYAGPKIQERLEKIAPSLELTVDYGWLWFIAQPLFWLLSFLHDFIGNWGWAIVFTTLVVKLLFYKLSATSYRSMANLRRVAPMMQRMKEQYGDDRQKMSAAMMDLYKKEKINPLGGCLPILVQMPVFIALYWVLLESVELRQAPFILWINDLSVMDPYFILPILMGASMFVMQLLSPAPADPMQAKVMKLMPIIFTFFFLWFPAGLVLYWVVNNLLSIAQQWYITRQIESAAAAKT